MAGLRRVPEEDAEVLQRFVDALFADRRSVSRLDVVIRAQAHDLPADLLELIELLPPRPYLRQTLCDQLNSALKGHGWTGRFRTVE